MAWAPVEMAPVSEVQGRAPVAAKVLEPVAVRGPAEEAVLEEVLAVKAEGPEAAEEADNFPARNPPQNNI